MTIQELESGIRQGAVETVVVGCSDFYGRLHGKRLDASYFLHHARNGVAVSGASLASHVDGHVVPGVSFHGDSGSSDDLVMHVEHAVIRPLPWFPRTALVIADIVSRNGDEVASMPRTLLRRQLDRFKAGGWTVRAAAEFEFYLLRRNSKGAGRGPLEQLHHQGSRDYNILRSAEDEWLLSSLRSYLNDLGVPVESSKVEDGPGQVEVNLLYSDGLESGDRAFLFRQATKEVAALAGLVATFMAKPFARDAGSGCHLHVSVLDEHGRNLFAAVEGEDDLNRFLRAFLGGLQHLAPDLLLAYAPLINSYKRYVPDSFAPTENNWGIDDRLVAFRVTGQGQSRRIENRLPGADLNPYVALAAMLGAGLYGIDHQLEPVALGESGTAVEPGRTRLPRDFHEGLRFFSESARAREILGEVAVSDLSALALGEAQRFLSEVTDWERRLYLEAI